MASFGITGRQTNNSLLFNLDVEFNGLGMVTMKWEKLKVNQ
jgi:hypothetical protein